MAPTDIAVMQAELTQTATVIATFPIATTSLST